MNKDEFIREVSRRSGRTLKDVRLVWDCVEDIFDDAIRAETELNIRGFGKLYFTKTKKNIYNVLSGEGYKSLNIKKVSFRLAINLRKILKK